MPPITVIGLISGTSMDGVDAALLTIEGCGLNTRAALKGAIILAYPSELKERLLLSCDPHTSSVDEICRLNFMVGEHFAAAAREVAALCSLRMAQIDLIGSHGQTIYHSPSTGLSISGEVNSTLQIGEPDVIAARTGVTTVADFRTADMAVGGTGAPLAPYAHFILFKHLELPLAVQNIGGISNLTLIPSANDRSSVLAFDSGPGNMVVDAIVKDITGGMQCCDEDGSISSGGRINGTLLQELLKHPYFETPPPKACGREMFGVEYAKAFLRKGREMSMGDEDLVATALALTAHSIALGYRLHVLPNHSIKEVLLCGGGAKNPTLKAMLEELLHPVRIGVTDDYGVSSDYLEAMTFAILANDALHGLPANLPSVTGARKSMALGKIVPGDNFASLIESGRLAPKGQI